MSENSRLKEERGPAGLSIAGDNKPEDSKGTIDTDLTAFKKKERKSYTLVRIEDSVVEDFREIVRLFNLESHGPLMNTVLKDFAKTKLNKQ